MAKSTKSEKAYAKEYYRSHPAQKKEKIRKQVKKQQEHRTEYNAYQRERYHSNSAYRKYKIRYARNYYKSHKMKKGN